MISFPRAIFPLRIALAGLALIAALWVAAFLLPTRILAQPDPAASLHYLDEESIGPIHGSITYTISASGTRKVEGETETIDLHATVTQKYDSHGYTRTEEVSGSRSFTRDQETVHTTYSKHSTVSEPAAANSGLFITVSRKLGLAYFTIGARDIAEIQRHDEGKSAEGEAFSNDSEESWSVRIPDHTRNSGASEAAGEIEGGIPLRGGYIESPFSGGSTSGSFSVPMLAFNGSLWNTEPAWRRSYDGEVSINEGFFPGSITVTWSLGGKPAQDEVIIKPEEDYFKWIPEAGDNEESPGNTLFVVARVQQKGKPDQPGRKAKFKFALVDVSKEMGICVNFPVKGARKDFDLEIDRKENPTLLNIPEDGQSAESKEGLAEAGVTITSHDWGAYGKLKVIAEFADGSKMAGEYRPGQTNYLAIPKDKNLNQIADKWEEENKVLGNSYPLTWDEDPQPASQRRNGDGYTLHEEYRGFMVKEGTARRHLRTDPLHKDLFVFDPDGLFKRYYEPYNPSRLHLHYVDESTMRFTGEARNPDNRWVNCNSSSDRWYARQYALFVKQWTAMVDIRKKDDGTYEEGKTYGEASPWVLEIADKLNGIPVAGKWTQMGGNPFKQPLKSIYVVKVSPATVQMTAGGVGGSQEVFTTILTNTVLHEVGHAIGIPHHNSPDGENGIPAMGGVLECAMRYPSPTEYDHPQFLKIQKIYCKASQMWRRISTVEDARGNKSAKEEILNSDNCWGQIDVKSDP